MFTLRALPPADGNMLLAAYHDGLRRHWSVGRRMIARLIAASGRSGWAGSERRLLCETVRAQGLSMRDRKGVHRLLNPGAFPAEANPLKNKQLFARHAVAAGLPVPDSFALEASDITTWLHGQSVIIAKPSYCSKGQGVVRFEKKGGRWEGAEGPIADDALRLRLLALWAAGGVIQHCLATHGALADISPGALPTLRVVTCLDEVGTPEACALALRLSAGGGQPVDNFNAGNLVLSIDGDGRCGPVWQAGPDGAPIRCDRHPLTGAMISGRPVPDLDAAVALALRAHLAFRSGFTVIGWDVGLTPDGPVLVEGNWNPGTDIVQLVSGRGLADSRLGALYCHHLRHLPSRRWQAAGAIERDARRA
ncbi:sugar-transfer associated ATP-grasp domain-containing protein [Sphingobium sp. AP49]|uniref:sugar-transfer associated ATP-grasp domain-containing protein n=1 Tax=Sphingobium sp. AP49 TaxID=1144307 RepID=UPI00026ED73A|nr:sugar-transfer associated ATP-grasp domain-containing protein [Sphingobium sp. AP49]WHO38625.1 sugar-transfer associated ATP-grasp domain-containing protein [Sphingobium sp. AP49]